MKDLICPQGQGKTILIVVIPVEHVPKAKHNSRYCTISILHNHTNCNILLQLCTTTPINSPFYTTTPIIICFNSGQPLLHLPLKGPSPQGEGTYSEGCIRTPSWHLLEASPVTKLEFQ